MLVSIRLAYHLLELLLLLLILRHASGADAYAERDSSPTKRIGCSNHENSYDRGIDSKFFSDIRTATYDADIAVHQNHRLKLCSAKYYTSTKSAWSETTTN